MKLYALTILQIFLTSHFHVDDSVNHICFPKTHCLVDMIRSITGHLKIVVQKGNAIHFESMFQKQTKSLLAVSLSPFWSVDNDSHITPVLLWVIVIINISNKSSVAFSLQESVESVWLFPDPRFQQILPLRFRRRNTPVRGKPWRIISHRIWIRHHFHIKPAILSQVRICV